MSRLVARVPVRVRVFAVHDVTEVGGNDGRSCNQDIAFFSSINPKKLPKLRYTHETAHLFFILSPGKLSLLPKFGLVC